MANDQINVPSLVLIIVLSGLIIRYLFFSSPPPPSSPEAERQRWRETVAARRHWEELVVRIQQMFPQTDRRAILWDLHRNGGNIAATTERILAGRLETPPVTFQPMPPPPTEAPARAPETAAKTSARESQPDLIKRYSLQDKVVTGTNTDGTDQAGHSGGAAVKDKGWSSNKDERHALLQKRRDDMILAARRKMEAKIAAEKAAGGAP